MDQGVPQWLLAIALGALASLLGGIALWLVKRSAGRVDMLDDRMRKLELQVAGELPTKEDMRDIERALESVQATMGEVRDMVVRMDERNKAQNHG